MPGFTGSVKLSPRAKALLPWLVLSIISHGDRGAGGDAYVLTGVRKLRAASEPPDLFAPLFRVVLDAVAFHEEHDFFRHVGGQVGDPFEVA
jgi:hypothetical protein